MTKLTKRKIERPISKTVTATSGATNLADVFEVPWDKIGYLKRIEGLNDTASDADLTVKDSYEDTKPSPEVSGFATRKQFRIAAGSFASEDVKEDVPLLGLIRLQSTVSGFDVTITGILE